jgi:DMSO/TMAO reductase YedYZ molybdopterin-dependent catalytic subunit
MAAAKLDPAGPYMRHPLRPHQLADRVTSLDDMIVLCHLGVPRLEAADWSLTIDGLVRKPLQLTFDDLLRWPSADIVSIHECCGSPLKPELPMRRVCNVVWKGARLADLLAACEPRPEARFVWSSGADHGVFEGVQCDAFVKDLPLARALTDALVAYEMNGRPLKPEHGFPVRLVVPGFYGTNSVKWLRRLTLAETRADSPFTTRWYNDAVRNPAGPSKGETRPVWSIAPESLIVSVAPEQTVAVGEDLDVWGWAWGDGGIVSVTLSADDGDHWIEADLEPASGRAWQRFSATWRPLRRGAYRLMPLARSTDGLAQPMAGARNAVQSVPIVAV